MGGGCSGRKPPGFQQNFVGSHPCGVGAPGGARFRLPIHACYLIRRPVRKLSWNAVSRQLKRRRFRRRISASHPRLLTIAYPKDRRLREADTIPMGAHGGFTINPGAFPDMQPQLINCTGLVGTRKSIRRPSGNPGMRRRSSCRKRGCNIGS